MKRPADRWSSAWCDSKVPHCIELRPMHVVPGNLTQVTDNGR